MKLKQIERSTIVNILTGKTTGSMVAAKNRLLFNAKYLRTLYNIATAAAVVVAAASATNAVNIHNNNNSQTVVVHNKQRHNIGVDRNDGNQNHHSPSEIVANNSQHNLKMAGIGLEAGPSAVLSSYTAAGTLSDTSTPTQTPVPPSMPLSTATNLLCEVLEPEVSIRTMYKCCRSHFFQQSQRQAQHQHQHLQVIPPHNMTNTSTTTAPSPSPPASIADHVSTCIPASSTPAAHHGKCSGCQISTAASIQLANLIGTSMLMPQTAVTAATVQDVASKVSGTTINVTTDHSVGKKLAATSVDKVICRGANNVAESASSGGMANTRNPNSSSNKSSPHLASATKKATVQFQCEFCAFSCSWKYDLKLHLRQKHGIHNKKM
ncbi:uncharacterized protein LOC128868508 [Anastrepha ludens]|uniref:uncharacterized protein LOC128868508 n=1 Tax=Anastrepha ludens TaxID=28586 RepID=UPI0023B18509|nr:uncharacterized protein LOC128868508 [Anastrepha ludens]